SCELRNQRDTSKSMILVPLLNPKFAIELAARVCELRVRGTSLGMAVCALVALPLAGMAQDYPNRTVKIIVPFPAGGTADAMPRIIGDWLARKWGHPVVIE